MPVDKKLISVLFTLFLFNTASLANVFKNVKNTLPNYSKVYDASRNPFTDGVNAIKLARETHRYILIEVGGNWCRWCHILEKFITEHTPVYNALHSNYVLLKVNVDEKNDNAEFLKSFPKITGYPHFFIADSHGEVLYSTDTTHLLSNGNYSEQKMIKFLTQWRNKKTSQ